MSSSFFLGFGKGLCRRTSLWRFTHVYAVVWMLLFAFSTEAIAASSSSSSTPATTVIYFKNTANFATPYIHYFKTVPTRTSSTWPGVKMTSVNGVVNGGWYTYELAAPAITSSGVIFSNNSASKTVDLTVTPPNVCYNGTSWQTVAACGAPVASSSSSVKSSSSSSSSSSVVSSVVSSGKSSSSVASSVSSSSVMSSVAASSSVSSSSASLASELPTTIYFKNTANFATPYIHYFKVVPTRTSSTWPGVKMTSVNGVVNGGWYKYELAAPAITSSGIIFSNNSASKTADLTVTPPNVCYNGTSWQTVAACGVSVASSSSSAKSSSSSSSSSSVAASSVVSSSVVASSSSVSSVSSAVAVSSVVSNTSAAATTTVIYLKNNANLAVPYIHFFKTVPTRTSSTWPGVKMTSVNGVVNGGWYRYEFAAPAVTSSGIIFSNNSASKTADLTYTPPNNCYNGASWQTAAACGAPTVIANAGIDRKVSINSRQVLSAVGSSGNYVSASWTSPAWAGALKGSQVVTPPLAIAGTYTVTLTLTTAENTTFTDTMTLTVVASLQGLPERPFLETSLKFPLTGSVSTGSYRFVKAFPNLDGIFPSPVQILSDGLNSNLLYVVDKIGTVSVFPNSETVSAADVRTVLDISPMVRNSHEMGLLSMAFDPGFASNGFIYVYYVYGATDAPGVQGTPSEDTILERWTVNNTSNPTGVLPNSRVEILRVPQIGPDHKAGMMHFHPSEGYLYLGVGDGGYGNSAFPQVPVASDKRTNNSGQDTTTLRGKMIRIQILPTPGPDGKYYAIPPDNPFVGNSAFKPEIYSYGHRNAWRWEFDSVAPYTLWEAEVGQKDFEEVNIILKGKNYGWPVCEGTMNRGLLGGTSVTATKSCTKDYQPPVETESNSEGVAIIGGFVYRGTALPGLTGKYIFSDYKSKRIYGMTIGQSKTLITDAFPQNPVAFGTDMSGNNVFIASYGVEFASQGATSAIYKMVDDNVVPAVIPPKLSATGLFADLVSLTPSAGVIEYSVNTNGWFDGASARHFMAIPNDRKIAFDPTTLWSLPAGSVLVKHLSVEAEGNPNKPFTTSVLFLQADGKWQAANYQWNTLGTDADLVTTSSIVADNGVVNRQRAVQAPSDCGTCHSGSGSKNPLAITTRQLNGSFNYSGVPANQLTVFNNIGLFTTTIDAAASYSRFASPTDASASLDLRARSYLHTNCSHCHSSSTFMDMRFDTPLDAMRLVSVSGRVQPFDHANSLVYIYQTTDNTRMPRGSLYTNPDADKLFTDWIDAKDAVQTGVKLSGTQPSMSIGSSVTLTLNNLFDNGFIVPASAPITWSSSNPDTITVPTETANNAAVTALMEGSSTITASANGFSDSVSISVIPSVNPVTALQIVGPANLKMISGDTQQLVAVATNTGALTSATNSAIWSSSNPGVATVSASGLVTCGTTAGATTITASYSGITVTYTLTGLGMGQYVYFKKPSTWVSPMAYITTNSGGISINRNGVAPGAPITENATQYGANWFRISIPKEWANLVGATNIVFSDDGANPTEESAVNQSSPSWYDTGWLNEAPLGAASILGAQVQVGKGQVTVSNGLNQSGKLFTPGTLVDITADPAGPGMKFVHWEGTGVPYLLNANAPVTQMVVGNGLSYTLLAVFDTVTDAHVVGRQHYQDSGCAICHGATGAGGTAPSLLDVATKYNVTTLAAYISANMPKTNPGSCTGTCASSIASMMMNNAYEAPAGICDANSLTDMVPQPRGFRLLSSFEYNNTVRDLLGLSTNVDVTSGRIPVDLPVNGFRTDANVVFTDDFAKGYVLAAEAVAAMVTNKYNLAPTCSNVTCFVQTFGKRAFRRPLTTEEVTSLVAVQAEQGDLALLTSIFSSPALLYRSEVGVSDGQGYYQLTNYEIASLLSYTYWATTPDADLMAAADNGLLTQPGQIAAKVSQMLQNPKAKVAFERFITGWLDLDKEISSAALSSSLKTDMKAETIEFVKRTVFEGGTYDTLLTANYSFMTQQLATHYGLAWPGGTGMQRVDYTGPNNSSRRGILGHAGILALQSASEKTHPVKRGLFVRRSLLCQDFPPPPLGAALSVQVDPTLTVRERFENSHVKDSCKACHQYIDGVGFGLENYNANGLYVTTETTDNGSVKPINSAGYIGSLNSAETYLSETEPVITYQGLDELSTLIAESTNGKACYARQWYRYARGQREGLSDSCTLQVFGANFKSAPNATLLDLMVQFTQTKNYTLRK